MKKDMRDLFEHFGDETVDIKSTVNISSEKIIEMTKNKIKEDDMNLTKHKKKLSIPVLAAAMIAVLSVTVFAAHYFLSSGEVAARLEDSKLAECFSDEGMKFNFEPQTSGGYTFAILGIASGKNLSSFTSAEDNKSYIVGAIARTDGKALTDYPDVMVTPLISGYLPWQVNAFTMNGGRQSFLHEGVQYFIFDCDNLEIFADHTIYIAAYEGMAPGAEEFVMEPDGSIHFNDSYTGAKALFILPLDRTKADPEAARKLLEENELFVDDASDNGASDDGVDTYVDAQNFEMVTTVDTEEEMVVELREKN